MQRLKTIVHVGFALSLAACGGGGHLSVEPAEGGGTLEPLHQLVFFPGSAMEHPLPFRISGGIPPYERTIEDCPDWVTLFPDQEILAGAAPAGDRGKTFICTYRVTESDPGFREPRSVSWGLRLTVLPVVAELTLPRPGKIELSVGVFRSAPLPEASDGVPPYTYSFTCTGGSLPSGMGFAPETRMFAGTPDAPFRDSCTYTATDSAETPGTRSRAVEVQVSGPVRGTLTLPQPSRIALSVGVFRSAPLPEASDGVPPYTYSFTCTGGSLPSGMGFAPETRRFAGTPDAPFRDSCAYTVTDSAETSGTVSWAVEVEVRGPVTQPLTLPEFVVPRNVLRLGMNQRVRITFQPAAGGEPPYDYAFSCPGLPPGLRFNPLTRVLAGLPEAEYRSLDCTYEVADRADPAPSTFGRTVALIIEPEGEKWRFPTDERTLAPEDVPLDRADMDPQEVDVLPEAMGTGAVPVYRLLGVRPPLKFDSNTRTLEYEHRPGPDPSPGISTYRYQVVFGDSVEDTLCIDVSYRDEDEDDEDDQLIATVRIRDDAYFDGVSYLCLPASRQPASASHSGAPSNPVHTALAPVHARRALDVAHGAILDRVRGWSRGESSGDARLLSAIAPTAGIGSLSGRSQGFDYTGSSESLSAGAELGAGGWQAGLVGSFTRTELHYRAEAGLAEHGYVAGEHHTEVLSLHPFAAWHAPSGGHVWASLGAGAGHLRHRDDPGFPSWSRSDVHLRTWTAGASIPVADALGGDLEAEAGVESFSFEIDGGGRISSSLPALRGRDWRAGLAWSAPVPGAPSVSVAWRRLTGDGPEGGRLEAKGSVSVEGVFDPRLALLANAEGSFGLGDLEHDLWGLAAGVRFAPDASRRGFGLELDTRVESLEEGGSAGVGIRAEAGYGLWGGPLFGTLRPHVGLIRHPGGGLLRRSVGVDLRDTPHSRVKVEIHDHPRHRLRTLRFTVRQRF